MKITRRTILKSALVASPMLLASRVLGLDGETAPSERVRIGVIGLGGRGTYVANVVQQAKDCELVAVNDIFQPRVDGYLKNHPEIKAYSDFRTMIETEKLDGVCCETATHQRAWVAINAMLCGANVYIEKPMALTIKEGRAMADAAKKLNKVTQVGTQQRSLPLCKWACDQVANGAIGRVKTVLVPNFVGPNVFPDDDPKYKLDPKDCEPWWDIWTNQAKLRKCVPEIQHGWNNWADYDAGGLCFGVSGWGTHSFDQMQMAIGTSLTGPEQIILEEPCAIQDSGKFTNRPYSEEETGADYYFMAKVTGPRAKVKMLFPNGVEARFELDGDRGPGLGCIVVGDKGKIEINRHKISSNPKELAASIPDESRNTRDETVYHMENWAECIKTKEKCNADVEIGQRSTTICELINIVRATAPVGKVIYWNAEKEEFTNLPEGNKRLARTRREGWELPTV